MNVPFLRIPVVRSALKWVTSGSGAAVLLLVPIYIDTYAFTTFLGLTLGDAQIGLSNPFPFGAGANLVLSPLLLVIGLWLAFTTLSPTPAARLSTPSRTKLLFAATLLLLGVAKFVYLDVPVLQVQDTLSTQLPVVQLGVSPDNDHTVYAKTWRRIVCSRVSAAQIEVERRASGTPGRNPLDCGTAMSPDDYRTELIRQFATSAAVSFAMFAGWVLLFMRGGIAAFSGSGAGQRVPAFRTLVILSGIAAGLNLAAVPASYAKLVRSTAFPVVGGTTFIIAEKKDKVTLFVIKTATDMGIEQRDKFEGTRSTRRDVLATVFLTRLADIHGR